MISAPSILPDSLPNKPLHNPVPPKTTGISKKDKKKKGEYQKKLEEDNMLLQKQILELAQKINTTEAQNAALLQQLQFFRSCMPNTSPAQSSEANVP